MMPGGGGQQGGGGGNQGEGDGKQGGGAGKQGGGGKNRPAHLTVPVPSSRPTHTHLIPRLFGGSDFHPALFWLTVVGYGTTV